MAASDVRDVLDLPGASSAPRPKKIKTAAPKSGLRGLAREVARLGGDNPIAIVPESTQFKRKRFGRTKPAAKWELKPFTNSAREDGLVLRHWRRKAPEAPVLDGADAMDIDSGAAVDQKEDSVFAKYNVRVNTPMYTDEVYKEYLESEGWDQQETDYLLNLVSQWDLRWPLIWDRYEYLPLATAEQTSEPGAIMQQAKTRTLEDLKQRYYQVAAKVMVAEKPAHLMTQTEYDLHEKMARFSATQETARKKFVETMFARTREEASEEQSLLIELRRILARTDKLNEERRELYATLDAPPSTSNAGIYSSSIGLQQLLQQLMSVDKNKKRKSLMGPDNASPVPNAATQAAYDHRKESAQRQDSLSGAAGAAGLNKKGSVTSTGRQNEKRNLTPEQEAMYGVSHPERTTSGPYFRSERIGRVLLSKSAAQQGKILNTLLELGIPSRLNMPTEEVGKSYESLIVAISQMVDLKKASDKLAGEIAVVKETQAARARRDNPIDGAPEAHYVDAGDATAADLNATAEPDAQRAAGVRKRSASILSTTSQQSTSKRQKK